MDAKDIILGAAHNTQRFGYIFSLLQSLLFSESKYFS